MDGPLQYIKESFERVHWGVKTYWILPASLWNSTTITTLTYITMIYSLDYWYVPEEKSEFSFFVNFLKFLLILQLLCFFLLGFFVWGAGSEVDLSLNSSVETMAISGLSPFSSWFSSGFWCDQRSGKKRRNISKNNLPFNFPQCADEQSNKSMEDKDRTFTGWQSMVFRS